MRPEPALCSVVVPVHNEATNIPELYRRLKDAFSISSIEHEIIFVDDGSIDSSLKEIKQLSSNDGRIYFISFTRNFGHEAASTAGLEASRGECVVLMDADLQDPPELIPKFIELWREGYFLVYARRRRRHGESLFKRMSSRLFYRILSKLSDTKIPLDTGDFRLMDRAVVNDFLKCGEYNRFVRGLTSWVGYRQTSIEFDRPERFSGDTKYSVMKLLLLSLDVITSFSIIPLRVVSLSGLFISILSAALLAVILFQKLLLNMLVPGYAFLASGVLFLGGVQVFFLGVIGEYIGKIYRQVQQRPLYLIRENNIVG
jgi:dolichol-phosphate mannosyltransferase